MFEGLRVQGFGSEDLGFRVWGLRIECKDGLGLKDLATRARVWGLGFKHWGWGWRVEGL